MPLQCTDTESPVPFHAILNGHVSPSSFTVRRPIKNLLCFWLDEWTWIEVVCSDHKDMMKHFNLDYIDFYPIDSKKVTSEEAWPIFTLCSLAPATVTWYCDCSYGTGHHGSSIHFHFPLLISLRSMESSVIPSTSCFQCPQMTWFQDMMHDSSCLNKFHTYIIVHVLDSWCSLELFDVCWHNYSTDSTCLFGEPYWRTAYCSCLFLPSTNSASRCFS